MKTWLLRRLLLAVPTLLGLTLVTFALSRLAPGGPLFGAVEALEGRPLPRDHEVEMERMLGLDRPLPEQYLYWLRRFAAFDFGRSFAPGREPVAAKIAAAASVSIGLQAAALLLMYGIGVPLGLLCAARAGRPAERWAGALLFLLHSTPLLLLGTLLIALFCTGRLAALPMIGIATPGLEEQGGIAGLLDRLRHAVLPVACLTLANLAGVTRYARAGVVEALRQPFIQAARARGVPERRILTRHALRNGILPTITLLASILPWLVGGSVAVETLFGLPGLGRLSIDAILQRDYPTVMALSVLVGVATMIGFVLTDLLVALLGRRIELS